MIYKAYMKHLTYLFFALILISFPAHAQNIAVADADYLMNASDAAKSIKQQLKDKRAQYKKEFESTQTRLRNEETALLQKRTSMEPAEFKKQAQSFQTNLAKEEAAFQKKRAALDKGSAKALQDLQKEIGIITQEIAKEKGLDFVLPKQGLLYAAAGQIDITEDIMKKLNSRKKRIELKAGG